MTPFRKIQNEEINGASDQTSEEARTPRNLICSKPQIAVIGLLGLLHRVGLGSVLKLVIRATSSTRHGGVICAVAQKRKYQKIVSQLLEDLSNDPPDLNEASRANS